MEIGMIGLGRMGMNMSRRLLLKGHRVVAYNRTPAKTELLVSEGAAPAYSLADLAERLGPPRAVWLMLPAGDVVDDHLEPLSRLLRPGDTVVDGGNTFYKDDRRRSSLLAERGVRFLDVGVSGGIHGLQTGYCLMAGGDRRAYSDLEPIFQSLAPEGGYLYCGPTGAGHFIKMIHNAVEYAMMQAYGEGFSLLASSCFALDVDPAEIARLWNHGGVVRSWLLELAESALRKDRGLSTVEGFVEDSGEGRWAVQEALEKAVSVPAITASVMERFRSRENNPFAARLVAALRSEFGGHDLRRHAAPGRDSQPPPGPGRGRGHE